MNLKFFGQYKYVTTILVIFSRIFPNITDFLLKRVPALQECRPRRWFSTFNPSHQLLDTFKRDWVPYELVVINKGSRGKMDEGSKDCLIPVPDNQQARV